MSSLTDIRTPLKSGQFYHIYNRGNGGQIIFPIEKNYSYFLNKYKEYTVNYLDTYVYALLPNHFHLLVKVKAEEQLIESALKDFENVSQSFLKGYIITKTATQHQDLLSFKNLVHLIYHQPQNYSELFEKQNIVIFQQHFLEWIVSERLRRFMLGYAKAIQSQEKNHGSLFQKLFRRKHIDNFDYLKQAVLYIHRNFIHHGYSVDLTDEVWSSYQSIISNRPTQLKREEVLSWLGGREHFETIHAQYIDEWKNGQKWIIED